MQIKQNKKKVTLYCWFVWGLAAAYFFADYFARVSPSVMANELMRDFHMTAAGLGAFSSFFYWPYIVMQIPVGLLLDRYSTRKILLSMLLLTCFSCVLFAFAQSIWVADIARFLLGFGAAFAFVSALKIAVTWFPRSYLARLTGMTQALGMLGAAAGEAPVSHMVHWFGWRPVMNIMASLFLILAALVFFVMKPEPKTILMQIREKSLSVWQSLKVVFSNGQTWLNGVYVGLLFAPTAVFGELWGVNYIASVYHYHRTEAAFANGMIFIGWAIGGPLAGWLSDRIGRRKPVMYASALLCAILFSILLLSPHLSLTALCIILFLFGVSNTGVGIAYAVSAEINPKRVAGASLAVANMASILIGAILQPVIGLFLDFHGHTHMLEGVPVYSEQAYRTSFAVIPILLLLSLICIYFLKETYSASMPTHSK